MIAAPDIASVILRAIGFVLLFQAAGAALFMTFLGPGPYESVARIARVATVSSLLAIVFLCGHYGLEAARMSGDFSGAFDPALQGLVLRSSTSEALALQLAGMGLLVLGVRMPLSLGRVLRPIAVVLAAAAFTLTGHTSVHAHRAPLALLLLSHVLIGMFWFGSLVPLWWVSARESREVAGRIIESFSAAAVWLVPLLLVAGLAMTAILVPGRTTFEQPYGVLLIVKGGLFAALIGLAAANRRRWGPGIVSGVPGAALRFRITLLAELALIGLVLGVTACLTTFFSPE